ncbi:Mobile element protein [Polaromonas sp. CG9_12]|nr:Mobile element protein [Polaromonas sp. CG9_12]
MTDFTRAWRELSGKAISKAFVPLSFELGEAFQFDWSDEGLLVVVQHSFCNFPDH